MCYCEFYIGTYMYIAPTMCMRTYIVLYAMKNGKLLQDTVLCNVTASTHSKNPEV